MMRVSRTVVLLGILIFSLLAWATGWVTDNAWCVVGGVAGLCYVLLRMAEARRRRTMQRDEASATAPAPRPAQPPPRPKPADPGDRDALVDEMLGQDRYALLLRPQLAKTLESQQFRKALARLNEQMALVPDGEVILGRIDDALDDRLIEPHERERYRGRVVHVAPFFLDRYPVTNRQFYEFVASGGYKQMALWDKSMWTAVLELVDRSGHPGPRGWIDGCYLEGEDRHPVTGVTWYEAAAYARWVGKRLPSDAEWVKAGAWPTPAASGAHTQRRYPWGETLERDKANVWSTGIGRVLPVTAFEEGVSVGGVYQLIGNTWEWMAGSFRGTDHPDGPLSLSEPLKSIRGGAYDTYFDVQATCQFQSGEYPLSRKGNIGFRCAVGACDLLLGVVPQEEPETASV